MESFISRLRKEKLSFLWLSQMLFGDLNLRSGTKGGFLEEQMQCLLVGFIAWPHVLQACIM